MTTNIENKKIVYKVYHKKDIGRGQVLKYYIGSMWPHKTGKGFNLSTIHGEQVVFLDEGDEKEGNIPSAE